MRAGPGAHRRRAADSVRFMARPRIPSTAAVRVLRSSGVSFEPYLYRYAANGGTRQFADLFRVDEHSVIKTLIVQEDSGRPFAILMHGDREVSLNAVARIRGVKRCVMCEPSVATGHSGYLVGGTSPLGLKTALDILVERSILDLDRIYVNGGARGFIVGLAPGDLCSVLEMLSVQVGIGG